MKVRGTSELPEALRSVRLEFQPFPFVLSPLFTVFLILSYLPPPIPLLPRSLLPPYLPALVLHLS